MHIFHLKAAGRANWPKMEQAIARIKAARGAGQQVGADIYPYINNGLGITRVHPSPALGRGGGGAPAKLDDPGGPRRDPPRDGDARGAGRTGTATSAPTGTTSSLVQIKAAPYAEQGGKSLAAIARAAGKDPWDVFFEIAGAGAGACRRACRRRT